MTNMRNYSLELTHLPVAWLVCAIHVPVYSGPFNSGRSARIGTPTKGENYEIVNTSYVHCFHFYLLHSDHTPCKVK